MCNFNYHFIFGDPWNDFDHANWRDHCYIYPTQDGVIDTLAWEGFRAGVDDIRYASTLRAAIARGLPSDQPELREAANDAAQWLETFSVDDYTVQDDFFDNLPWREHQPDLNQVRTEIIARIMQLASLLPQTE